MGIINELAKEIVKEMENPNASTNASTATTTTDVKTKVEKVDPYAIVTPNGWEFKRIIPECEISTKNPSISCSTVCWEQENKEKSTGIKTNFKESVDFNALEIQLDVITDQFIQQRMMYPASEPVLEIKDKYWRAVEYIKRSGDPKKQQWVNMINKYFSRVNKYISIITHITELHTEQVLELQSRISILENDNIVVGNVVEKKKK
jgi:hypothetical protein